VVGKNKIEQRGGVHVRHLLVGVHAVTCAALYDGNIVDSNHKEHEV
jgi:hypothetical protein